MTRSGTNEFGAVGELIRSVVRKLRAPGIQYVVVDRAGLQYECHAGCADLSTQRPMHADITMMAFSMSKTVTAVAVLQLVEQGAVTLDEPIARIVPWQPYGPEVTIRQLLCHTSGIPNPLPLKWVHPVGDATFDERAKLDAVLRRHPRLNARPGTRYAYSNIGYWLLGYIVAAISGEPFQSYVANHIAAPLGDTGKELGYEIADRAAHACGYLERYSLFSLLKPWLIDRALIGDRVESWVQLRDFYPDGPAFGGLVGNARAFGRFLQDQLCEQSVLLGAGARKLMQARQSTTSGLIPMTLGWHIGTLGQTPHFYKEGGGGGFHNMIRLYAGAGIGTVVMTNATSSNVGKLLDAADGAVLRLVGEPGSAISRRSTRP